MLKIRAQPPTPKKTRERRLNDIGSIRLEMTEIYRLAKSGLLDKSDAKSLTWILQIIRDTLKLSDIEQRLEELEKQLEFSKNHANS